MEQVQQFNFILNRRVGKENVLDGYLQGQLLLYP